MNSSKDRLGYRVTEWYFGILSLVPPILFIGVFGRSDWTQTEITVFIGLLVWAIIVGSAVGLIRRSTPRHRILLALACPLFSTALAVSPGLIYDVSRAQFPTSIIVGRTCYFAIMLTILSSPALAAFLVTQGLKLRYQTSVSTQERPRR